MTISRVAYLNPKTNSWESASGYLDGDGNKNQFNNPAHARSIAGDLSDRYGGEFRVENRVAGQWQAAPETSTGIARAIRARELQQVR